MECDGAMRRRETWEPSTLGLRNTNAGDPGPRAPSPQKQPGTIVGRPLRFNSQGLKPLPADFNRLMQLQAA
eukprot:15468384-Alexandrium_andersonii.AAC.1